MGRRKSAAKINKETGKAKKEDKGSIIINLNDYRGDCTIDVKAKNDHLKQMKLGWLDKESISFGMFLQESVDSWVELLECKPFTTFTWKCSDRDREFYALYWASALLKEASKLSKDDEELFWMKLCALHPRLSEPPGGDWRVWLADKLKMCSFSEGNTFELYLDLSIFNHSCRPNCIQLAKDGGIHVYSIRPIQAGEELTICYILDGSNARRRKGLIKQFKFECKCEGCTSFDEKTPMDWIVLNSLKCHTCKGEAKDKCKKCHFMRYCSRECQTKDWPSHKLACDHMIETMGTLSTF